jgi:anti-anti-sigma factor
MPFRAEPTSSPAGFRLEGEVDLSNASKLSEILRTAVRSGGEITLDLSGITFMDSTAIQVLLKAGKDIGGRGRLVLANPSPLVLNVLRLIRADQLPGLRIVEEGG